MTEEPTVGIGEAARQLGTTERTLRYYEQLGLLPAVAAAGEVRRYGVADIERAREVIALRRLGLPVAEIAACVADPGEATLRRVLAEQLASLSSQIDELGLLRQRVEAVLSSTGEQRPVIPDLLEELSMSIVLTRIYTRTGDDGTTALGGGARVDKTDPRLEVMGDVDEVVTALGVALAAGVGDEADLVRRIQNDLFDLGADLAGAESALITAESVTWLEAECDRLNSALEAPASFVLPGTSFASAAVHQARAICRRAERHGWGASGVRDEALRYLNRLSDLLFILARALETSPESTWVPGGGATS